jgi:hypothetical protein
MVMMPLLPGQDDGVADECALVSREVPSIMNPTFSTQS